jgi:hypothetical protein
LRNIFLCSGLQLSSHFGSKRFTGPLRLIITAVGFCDSDREPLLLADAWLGVTDLPDCSNAYAAL